MSRWFRHYAGMMRDEKLVSAALRAKQPVERVIWIWGAILESAAEINDHGRYELESAEAAYFLRSDEADVCAVIDALTNLKRLADGRVVNWGSRQFDSDRSATRQAAYRERQKERDALSQQEETSGDGIVTPPSRHRDSPETETYTETKTEEDKKDIRAVAVATRPSVGKEFDQFWEAYPKRDGANPKVPARKTFAVAVKAGHDPQAIIGGARRYGSECRSKSIFGTSYVAQAKTWLHQARWEDYPETGPPSAEPIFAKPPAGMPTLEEIRKQFNGTQAGTEVRGHAGLGEGRPDNVEKLQLPGRGACSDEKLGEGRRTPDDLAGVA